MGRPFVDVCELKRPTVKPVQAVPFDSCLQGALNSTQAVNIGCNHSNNTCVTQTQRFTLTPCVSAADVNKKQKNRMAFRCGLGSVTTLSVSAGFGQKHVAGNGGIGQNTIIINLKSQGQQTSGSTTQKEGNKTPAVHSASSIRSGTASGPKKEACLSRRGGSNHTERT